MVGEKGEDTQMRRREKRAAKKRNQKKADLRDEIREIEDEQVNLEILYYQ